MRVVIDANVFAAALLRRDGTPRRAVDFAFEHCHVVWTIPIFDEINDVLHRPYFLERVDEFEREAMLFALVALGERAEPTERVRVVRDPKDDKYIEAAIAGSATAIVTGDADLLALDPHRGIRLLRPAAFLEFAKQRLGD